MESNSENDVEDVEIGNTLTSIEENRSIKNDLKDVPCPSLEFRLVNRLHDDESAIGELHQHCRTSFDYYFYNLTLLLLTKKYLFIPKQPLQWKLNLTALQSLMKIGVAVPAIAPMATERHQYNTGPNTWPKPPLMPCNNSIGQHPPLTPTKFSVHDLKNHVSLLNYPWMQTNILSFEEFGSADTYSTRIHHSYQNRRKKKSNSMAVTGHLNGIII